MRHLSTALVHLYGRKKCIKHEWFLCRPLGFRTAFLSNQLTPDRYTSRYTSHSPAVVLHRLNPELLALTLASLATPKAWCYPQHFQTDSNSSDEAIFLLQHTQITHTHMLSLVSSSMGIPYYFLKR